LCSIYTKSSWIMKIEYLSGSTGANGTGGTGGTGQGGRWSVGDRGGSAAPKRSLDN
jgi:hypothetical protein